MIVKMRKMDLLLYHKEREKFLEDLSHLGVVHITAQQPVESAVATELVGVVHLCERVVANLRKLQKEKNITPGKMHGEPIPLLHRFEELESNRERIDQEMISLRKDRSVLEPWGNFDPESVRRLSEAGLTMKFFSMPAKKIENLDKTKYNIEMIGSREGTVYFVSVVRGADVEIPDAQEERLPDTSIKALDEKLSLLQNERIEIEKSIDKMVDGIELLEVFRREKLNQLRLENARLSMKGEVEGKLLNLSGWVPLDKEKKVSEFLEKFPAYFSFRDPYEDEDVPVKLINRRFPTLFEPIIGLYSLPVYSELDVTPFVAPFFTIFFGLCLGDAGYGFVLTALAIIGRMKAGPKLKPFMTLGLFLGLSTFISGILLNSFFGQTIFGGEGIAGTPLFPQGVQYFAPLSAQVGEAGQIFPAMSLAILLGFIQVLFGMGLQSYLKMKDSGVFGGLQPIASMLMVIGGVIIGAHVNFLDLNMGQFSVGPVEFGAMLLAIPYGVGQGLLVGGLLLLLLFNNIEKKIFVRPLTGLWVLYNLITGLLSNILSYLRLFALGLAGGLLGGAFNQIAFMFISNPEGEINYASAGIIATILVLILGHSLNLALSAIGAFVHPLRLTFVEFYGNVGFKGGSKPYVPFAKAD